MKEIKIAYYDMRKHGGERIARLYIGSAPKELKNSESLTPRFVVKTIFTHDHNYKWTIIE